MLGGIESVKDTRRVEGFEHFATGTNWVVSAQGWL